MASTISSDLRAALGVDLTRELEILKPAEGKLGAKIVKLIRDEINKIVILFKTGEFFSSDKVCKRLDKEVLKLSQDLDKVESKMEISKKQDPNIARQDIEMREALADITGKMVTILSHIKAKNPKVSKDFQKFESDLRTFIVKNQRGIEEDKGIIQARGGLEKAVAGAKTRVGGAVEETIKGTEKVRKERVAAATSETGKKVRKAGYEAEEKIEAAKEARSQAAGREFAHGLMEEAKAGKLGFKVEPEAKKPVSKAAPAESRITREGIANIREMVKNDLTLVFFAAGRHGALESLSKERREELENLLFGGELDKLSDAELSRQARSLTRLVNESYEKSGKSMPDYFKTDLKSLEFNAPRLGAVAKETREEFAPDVEAAGVRFGKEVERTQKRVQQQKEITREALADAIKQARTLGGTNFTNKLGRVWGGKSTENKRLDQLAQLETFETRHGVEALNLISKGFGGPENIPTEMRPMLTSIDEQIRKLHNAVKAA